MIEKIIKGIRCREYSDYPFEPDLSQLNRVTMVLGGKMPTEVAGFGSMREIIGWNC